MKRIIPIIATVSLFAITHVARATDVDNYLIAKGQEFRQTNNAAPVLVPAEEPFRAFTSVMPTAPGLITNVTLRLPSSEIVPLEANEDGAFEAEASFTNKTQLVLRPRSFDTYFVGRATPCASFAEWIVAHGAHGVTRPTCLTSCRQKPRDVTKLLCRRTRRRDQARHL